MSHRYRDRSTAQTVECISKMSTARRQGVGLIGTRLRWQNACPTYTQLRW